MPRFSISKQVTRQLRATERVISSASELAGPIADAIAAKVESAQQPGQTPIDWRQVQETCARVLNESAERLRQLDDAHAGLDVAGQLLRNRRDEAVAALREVMRQVRYFLDKNLPEEDVKDILPQRRNISNLDPANLVRLGHHLAGQLRAQLVSARIASPASPSQPSAEGLSAELEAATQAAEATIAALESELRRRSYAYDQKGQEKDDALDRWRRMKDLLSGIYRVAGFDYLVDQLRIATSRKKGAMEPEAETMLAGLLPAPETAPPAADGIGFRI